MRPGVLLAVPGRAEIDLVAALDAPGTGVRVVRRCADPAEVLAAALAGVGRVAVVETGSAGVDRAFVARLRAAGVAVVLLAGAEDGERARALGAEAVVPAGTDPAGVVRAVRGVVRTGEEPAPDDGGPAGLPEILPPQPGRAEVRERGRLVAVWGPHGSPGRTTTAINLAAELAALGAETLLVDADTYGGCVGQALGLLDESPGIAAAARSAGTGTLDATGLAALSPAAEPGLRVLTGLARPDRWRELPGPALEALFEVARQVAPWTVVDCGFCLEEEPGAGFEAMLGPRRNAATRTALAAADLVLAVGSADPVGIQRLVQGLADLDSAEVTGPGAERAVVLTRVRAATAGPRPEQAVTEALVRYAGVTPILVPDDRPAYDRALLEGATLRAVAPSSPALAAITGIAEQLLGVAGATRRPGRRSGRLGARDARRPD